MMGRYVNNEKVSFDQKRLNVLAQIRAATFVSQRLKNAFVLVA